MNVPYLTTEAVKSWILSKKEATSTKEGQITFTTGKIRGFIGSILKKSICIHTNDGPSIYISKNALSYLSESEKQAAGSEEEKLSQLILAETKLAKITHEHSAPITEEQRKALEAFLDLFGLELRREPTSHLLTIDSFEISSDTALGSSTPEFIQSLVQRLKQKNTPSVQAHYMHLETPESAHAQITNFSHNPNQADIPMVVKSFLSIHRDQDPLSLRKWIKKTARHFDDKPKEKEALFCSLIAEYERQSKTFSKKVENRTSFEEFFHAVLEEFLGPKESSGRYDYLSAALLSAENLPNLSSMKEYMKMALSFYSSLHEHAHREEHPGTLENECSILEAAYREEGKPPLFERIKTIQQKETLIQ